MSVQELEDMLIGWEFESTDPKVFTAISGSVKPTYLSSFALQSVKENPGALDDLFEGITVDPTSPSEKTPFNVADAANDSSVQNLMHRIFGKPNAELPSYVRLQMYNNLVDAAREGKIEDPVTFAFDAIMSTDDPKSRYLLGGFSLISSDPRVAFKHVVAPMTKRLNPSVPVIYEGDTDSSFTLSLHYQNRGSQHAVASVVTQGVTLRTIKTINGGLPITRIHAKESPHSLEANQTIARGLAKRGIEYTFDDKNVSSSTGIETYEYFWEEKVTSSWKETLMDHALKSPQGTAAAFYLGKAAESVKGLAGKVVGSIDSYLTSKNTSWDSFVRTISGSRKVDALAAEERLQVADQITYAETESLAHSRDAALARAREAEANLEAAEAKALAQKREADLAQVTKSLETITQRFGEVDSEAHHAKNVVEVELQESRSHYLNKLLAVSGNPNADRTKGIYVNGRMVLGPEFLQSSTFVGLEDKFNEGLERIIDERKLPTTLLQEAKDLLSKRKPLVPVYGALLKIMRRDSVEEEFDSVDYRSILDEVVVLARRKNPQVNIDYRVEKDLTVYGAPQLLKAALLNVIDNAAQASGRGGSVLLQAETTRRGNLSSLQVYQTQRIPDENPIYDGKTVLQCLKEGVSFTTKGDGGNGKGTVAARTILTKTHEGGRLQYKNLRNPHLDIYNARTFIALQK